MVKWMNSISLKIKLLHKFRIFGPVLSYNLWKTPFIDATSQFKQKALHIIFAVVV
jgi:hypothetical protein